MERRNFSSPIRVGLAQKKDYNVEVYLDTDANAYLMSKKYIGDDFSFMLSDISVLNDLRNRLYDKEMLQRKQRDIQNNAF
jgi:hypothetical protein